MPKEAKQKLIKPAKIYEPVPFRYFGSKRKYIKLYRRPENYTRIVELFLGSGVFSMNSCVPCLGYELNEGVCQIYNFLKNTTKERLLELNQYWLDNRATLNKQGASVLPFEDPGIVNYFRINISSVYTGQLVSKILYAQHSLPIDKTIACLDQMKNLTVVNDDYSKYVPQEGDLVFVDPPYLNTKGGYISEDSDKVKTKKPMKDHTKSFDPNRLTDFLKTVKNPIIFTYGDGAEQTFPEYKWEKVAEASAAKINGKEGGSSKRTEYVSYLNF